MDNLIYLKCVKEGPRLRVKVVSAGYNQNANCQFPKDIRKEGQFYSVPVAYLQFQEGAGRKFFYSITKKNVITLCDAPKIDATKAPQNLAPLVNRAKAKAPPTKEQLINSLKDHKVYTASDDNCCVICLAEQSAVVFIPCGHFCTCDSCCGLLNNKECPICETKVIKAVDQKLIT